MMKKDGVLMKKVKRCIIRGKREVCILLCVMSVLNITGCDRNRNEYQEEQTLSVQEYTDEVMNQVLEALNAHDAEQLTNIFSEGVRTNVSNLSDMSEAAVEFYQGTGEIVKAKYVMTEKKSERGTISIVGNSKYTVETAQGTYLIRIVVYSRNDFDESMKGLYLLQITTEEVHVEGFKWKNKDDDPGIYIQNDRADEYEEPADMLEKVKK